MAGQVRVEGARQLRSTLRKAGADMKDLSAAHREVAGIVADRARPATPHRTGRLAKSVRAGGTQKAAVIRAGRGRGFPYAEPIHWGWPSRKIAAQPWISEAAAESEPVWVAVYSERISDLLRSVRGK